MGVIAEAEGQIDLLALNAAIEAARAGKVEDARTMNVVARQLREVANRFTA